MRGGLPNPRDWSLVLLASFGRNEAAQTWEWQTPQAASTARCQVTGHKHTPTHIYIHMRMRLHMQHTEI